MSLWRLLFNALNTTSLIQLEVIIIQFSIFYGMLLRQIVLFCFVFLSICSWQCYAFSLFGHELSLELPKLELPKGDECCYTAKSLLCKQCYGNCPVRAKPIEKLSTMLRQKIFGQDVAIQAILKTMKHRSASKPVVLHFAG